MYKNIVYIRNNCEFNWITWPIDETHIFNEIRVFGKRINPDTEPGIDEVKKENTVALTKCAKKYKMNSIGINFRGSIKLDKVLDIDMLTRNGINIEFIHDITPVQQSISPALQRALKKAQL